jgi:hypothetical protein
LTSGMPGKTQLHHHWDVPEVERHRRYGSASFELATTPVAGEAVKTRFRFEAGETTIPTGGRIRFAWRWPFDWEPPSPRDVILPPAASAEATFQPRGDLDAWNHHIELKVTSGALNRGDVAEFRCGGEHGWGAPTFSTQAAGFLVAIDPTGEDEWIRLVDPPSFVIDAGPPTELLAVAQGGSAVGEVVQVAVRAVDQWGNAAALKTSPALLAAPGMEVSALEPVANGRVSRFAVTWSAGGVYRVRAHVPGSELEAESNPVQIGNEPDPRPFWGDLHGGQTGIGCGTGSLEAQFAFARDVASLQFTSQQANDHYIPLPVWNHVRKISHAFNDPGRFTCYLGCEWSPYTVDGGDRNVIYRDDEPRLRRSDRFYTEAVPDSEPDLKRAPEFLAAMRDEEVLLNLHVGGRPTNLDYHEPKIEPLFEIHSTHGTSEWFVEDALSRGYRVGITGGADGVMGRPGACRPGRRVSRNVRSGLTAVFAKELDRESLWEAFHARRCYATSGPRILLWVEVDGHPMGAAYETDGAPEISIQVHGTAPIEHLDLLRGTTILKRWSVAEPSADLSRVLWGGTEQRGTAGEQKVVWDGALRALGGEITSVSAVGLQSGTDHVRQMGRHQVSWSSATAGNDMGLICRLEGDAGARFQFETGPCAFDFSMAQTSAEGWRVDAGGASRFVEVGPAAADDGPRDVEYSFCDEEPLGGEIPYWVRVVQVDRARAWSSPVNVIRPG